MVENECPVAAHEQRFKNIEDDVSEIKGNVFDLTSKVTKMDKDSAVANSTFATALENLGTLPDILSEIRFSNKIMRKDVDSTIKDIDSIKKQLNSVDDEGKVNIRVWIRDNWLSAVLAIGGIIAIIANFSK